jgi:CD2 antigen cytoplasmic tail-binding protein 2
MSEDTDSEEEDCSKNEECKNPEPKKSLKDEPEEKDYNSEEDENFNDANFIKSMKEGKYRDKHFRRFSKQNDGIEFTAFDLREENEEGHFDKNMNYIPNKEEFDPWYESVKEEIREKELLKYKRKRNEKESDGKSEEDDKDEEYSKYGDEDLYYKEEKITKDEINEIKNEVEENRIKLIPFLQNKESINKALKRLKPKNKNEDKTQFNELLNLISKLTELSYFDVYTDTIDNIIKDYGIENLYLWKYKTIINNEEQIFESFSTKTIKKWIKENYFTETENIKFYFMLIDPINKEKNKDSNIWFDTKSDLYQKYLS